MDSESNSDENEEKGSDRDDVNSPIHAFGTTVARDSDDISQAGRTSPRDSIHESQSDISETIDTEMQENQSDHSVGAEDDKADIELNPEHTSQLNIRKTTLATIANDSEIDIVEASSHSEDLKELHSDLQAFTKGKLITIYLTVDKQAFDKDTALATVTLPNGAPVPNVLGNDGNQFYCQVCKDFGDVVCCDGCPRVYHQMCIPTTDLSRQALDNDDDPWFCPVCMKKKKIKAPPANPGPVGRASERRVKRKCTECQQSGGELLPCHGCGVVMHFPSCRISEEFKESLEDQSSVPLCSNCRVEAVVGEEELAFKQNEDDESSQAQARPARTRSYEHSDADDESQNGEEEDEMTLNELKRSKDDSRKKYKRPSLLEEQPARIKGIENKKKKKRKHSSSFGGEESPNPRPSPAQNDHDYYAKSVLNSSMGLVRATPALFFFLNDNRARIDRVLSRKHRYFNRLPKGVERNELIAKEGAKWWVKLSQSEQKRYVDMSMQDFENRVIQWKQEKTIQEMLWARDPDEKKDELGDDNGDEKASEGPLQRYQYHHRLYLSTSVGSKPFTPEQGKSNNRVLLELLQDIRFHPLPMLSVNRTDGESSEADLSKACIPYFDVHGPISTSVGDECLGCTRGWNHHCSVLKRRLPAIEYRARLQPPLSSLLASRVGLGLKPKIHDNDSIPKDDFDEYAELFQVRETKKAKETKLVPPIPSFTLRQPSTRVDDVVHFVEEALAMKVPEPPRPAEPSFKVESQKKISLSRGKLPFSRKLRNDSNGDAVVCTDEHDLNRCGRCRAIIRGDTGCIQCRRAQLVINTSKKSSNISIENPPSAKGEKDSSDFLKVQTSMLGRLSAKESNFDEQSENDRRVADAILKMRWTPCAVLPPSKPLIPNRYHDNEAEWESETQCSAEQYPESELIDEKDAGHLEYVATDGNTEHVNAFNEDDSEGVGGRRQRSARLMAAASILALCADTGPSRPSSERQQITLELKEEAKEVHNRCIRIACSGILLAMMRRDPLRLFAEPVAENIVGYSTVVKEPIDFTIVRTRVLKGKYNSVGAFVADARLLCTNALAFNPPGSIYFKTASELLEVVDVMADRATRWISVIKDAHSPMRRCSDFDRLGTENEITDHDSFEDLRRIWPDAVDMFESGDYLMEQINADLMRTKENENAYYGSIAVQRAAAAAEASLAPYPHTGGVYSAVAKRNHNDDESLRRMIDLCVSQLPSSLQLKRVPTWREEAVIRLLRRVQGKRVEGRILSENGCARCDGVQLDPDDKAAMTADAVRWGRTKKKGELDNLPRVAESRLGLTTGNASINSRNRIKANQSETTNGRTDKKINIDDGEEDQWNMANKAAVSVRGSRVHGWGLFADQSFKAGDVVAEYVGEYISNAVADAREKIYQERRIQDYQFRVDESLVIDATLKGGHGRYINHSCNPSCIAKIFDGKAPDTHLKRVIIIAQRDISSMEEITYDYQFPLELDLDARIPCNCGSELCRGFMNWDLPEKGSKCSATRAQKRGGNMRDRIRRLGKKTNKRSSP